MTVGGTKWYIVHPVQNATRCGTICSIVQAAKREHARNVSAICDHGTQGRIEDKFLDRDLRADITVITTDSDANGNGVVWLHRAPRHDVNPQCNILILVTN
jgi:hypothetical protein